jgi:hypothetical protein
VSHVSMVVQTDIFEVTRLGDVTKAKSTGRRGKE